MAIETLYNENYTSPTNTGRLQYTNVGSSNFILYSSGQTGYAPVCFKDSTLAVWDAVTGGTQLTEGTDYVTDIESEVHTTNSGYSVKCRVRMITHTSGNIWIDCDIVAQDHAAEVTNDLQTQISAISGGVVFDIYNMELSNGTDTANDIDIAVGTCLDSTLTNSMTLSSAMTKQLDATWAAGTGNGGRFAGTMAVSTWFHVFAIRKDSDGSTDAGFDTSVTAANIPAGYTDYRCLGSVYVNSGGTIDQFIHTWQDKTFKWSAKTQTQASWQVPTTATLTTMDVPTGRSVKPLGLFTSGLAANNNIVVCNIFSYNESPPAIAASLTGVQIYGSSGSSFNADVGHVYSSSALVLGGSGLYQISGQLVTNTSGQLYFIRDSVGSYRSSDYYSTLQTHGWVDYTL